MQTYMYVHTWNCERLKSTTTTSMTVPSQVKAKDVLFNSNMAFHKHNIRDIRSQYNRNAR